MIKKYQMRLDMCFLKETVCCKMQVFKVSQSDDVLIFQPIKKKKGKELTDEEKDKNRRISKIRIRIEYVVSSIKRCRIVKKIRNWPTQLWILLVLCTTSY
jgi:hypothetical protein